LRFATEKPRPNSSGESPGQIFKKVSPISRPAPASLLFFYDQPPDVPVRFDHCMVDGPVCLLTCVENYLPERIIQGTTSIRGGWHEIISSGSPVEQITMIYDEAGAGKVRAVLIIVVSSVR
jgi:hypothetical protein